MTDLHPHGKAVAMAAWAASHSDAFLTATPAGKLLSRADLLHATAMRLWAAGFASLAKGNDGNASASFRAAKLTGDKAAGFTADAAAL